VTKQRKNALLRTLLYIFFLENGAPTRTRTADLLITNQLLIKLTTSVQQGF